MPSPFAVILSAAKDLCILLRVSSARNLALRWGDKVGYPEYAGRKNQSEISRLARNGTRIVDKSEWNFLLKFGFNWKG
jgi:hypothetical protein